MNAQKANVVITGVSRGLGLALAQQFAAAGHVVAGCARDAEMINDLTQQLPAPHRFDAVDLANNAEVVQWSETVMENHGAPDLLINNAAFINQNAPLWEVPVAEFSHIVDINIKGVFSVCRAFLPKMINNKRGVVVNLSSGWGRSVAADVAPYCATKWAIEGMTQALAMELPDGMAAVPLNPGVINTDMLQSCFGAAASDYRKPTEWAKTAVPFLLDINANDNGKPLTAP